MSNKQHSTNWWGKEKKRKHPPNPPQKTRLFRRRNFSSFRWSWSLLLALALIERGGQIEGHEEKESFLCQTLVCRRTKKTGTKNVNQPLAWLPLSSPSALFLLWSFSALRCSRVLPKATVTKNSALPVGKKL